MKTNIILQQDENKSLSKNLDSLISKLNTKIEISSILQENVVKQIKETIISIAEDNNYWQQVFAAKQTKETNDEFSENQKKDQKLIYESQFTKYYNYIIQQTQKKEQKKDQKKAQDETAKKLQDAAKSQSSGSPDEITLVVTSPDDFEFQNANGERFESKKSLQHLDSFLKKNISILKSAIQKNNAKNAQNKAAALKEAMDFVQTNIFTLKVFSKQKNYININVLTECVKKCESASWKYVAKEHKFGDRVKNKAEYQKLYFILIASLITYIAIKKNNNVNKLYQIKTQRQIAGAFIARLRKQKIDIFDKKILESKKINTLKKTPEKYKNKIIKVYDLIIKNAQLKDEYIKLINDIPAYDIVKDAWLYNFKNDKLIDLYGNLLTKIDSDLIIISDANINKAAAFFNDNKNKLIDIDSLLHQFKNMIKGFTQLDSNEKTRLVGQHRRKKAMQLCNQQIRKFEQFKKRIILK